ncbi:hypothetical protein [Vibrio marisflavi]|uniref:Uncharacterized protein n=1 Tax=Vibrio marisflavi CECT 7928 TaxID=634439 RepID=A0ABN8E066_9VIBR|nr:hypothetical protein [Vibrio marisflavi]CAH0536397.1 hypothetical protein VMF7928_00402 [Vibrio marisflavi CECT 7928]
MPTPPPLRRSNAITAPPVLAPVNTSNTLPPMYKDMLNLFSNTSIEGLTLIEKVQTAVEGLSTTNDLADSISQASKGKDFYVTQGINKAKSGVQDSKAYKYIKKIIKAVKDKLLEFFQRHGGAILEHIKDAIISMVPKLIFKVLEDVAPIYGDIKKAATAIYPVLQKSVTYYKTRHLGKNAAYASAEDVIETVRAEVASVAIEKGVVALTSIGSIFIDVGSLGISSTVTTVLKAVKAVFDFLKGLFDRYMMVRNFKKFRQECINLKLKAGTLTATRFKKWLREQMETIPILASYIVCMPCYSSPYNFLDIVSARPNPPSKTTRLYRRIKKKFSRNTGPVDPIFSHQKDLLSAYRSLQDEARAFISQCPIQLTSEKPGAMQVLNAARGETNFIPGTDEDAFKKAVRKQKIQNLLDGTTIKEKISETFTVSNMASSAFGQFDSYMDSLNEEG